MLNVTLGTDVAANSRSGDVAYWHIASLNSVQRLVQSWGRPEVDGGRTNRRD